jgi:hypothetical protein
LEICIFLYDRNYLIYHNSFVVSALMGLLACTIRIIFRKISIEPYPRMPRFINPNMFLHNSKIPRLVIQFLKPQKRTSHNIQTLLKRYIRNITKSNRNMLDINIRTFNIRTYSFTFQRLIMKCINQILLS